MNMKYICFEIPQWNKNIYFTVTSHYQRHENQKHHWASDNEKQVPFFKLLINLNKDLK
jgi:hypothetical protein